MAKKAPLVSVGIPCFNRPDSLEKLLGSITAQSFRDIEILISDNCSPNPGVQQVAQRYAAEDARIKVFRQPSNIGLVANHQFVKDKARGKYFLWAHDDDEFPRNYVDVCLSHFEDDPDVVLVGPSCDRYFDGKYLSTYETYTSTSLNTYQRLRKLLYDAFKDGFKVNHWRFEQYFNGLCLLEAMPTRVSEYNAGQFYLFFFMSERGTFHHAPELKLIKHTSQENYDAYQARSRYRIPKLLKYFRRELQDYSPLMVQMINTILASKKLTLIEKSDLELQCLMMFSCYFLRSHPRIVKLIQTILRI